MSEFSLSLPWVASFCPQLAQQMLDCSLECSKWGITCFLGVGGQQFQKLDKSFKNNGLKHVTKPFLGAGLVSFLVQADTRAPAEIACVAGSCAA